MNLSIYFVYTLATVFASVNPGSKHVEEPGLVLETGNDELSEIEVILRSEERINSSGSHISLLEKLITLNCPVIFETLLKRTQFTYYTTKGYHYPVNEQRTKLIIFAMTNGNYEISKILLENGFTADRQPTFALAHKRFWHETQWSLEQLLDLAKMKTFLPWMPTPSCLCGPLSIQQAKTLVSFISKVSKVPDVLTRFLNAVISAEGKEIVDDRVHAKIIKLLLRYGADPNCIFDMSNMIYLLGSIHPTRTASMKALLACPRLDQIVLHGPALESMDQLIEESKAFEFLAAHCRPLSYIKDNDGAGYFQFMKGLGWELASINFLFEAMISHKRSGMHHMAALKTISSLIMSPKFHDMARLCDIGKSKHVAKIFRLSYSCIALGLAMRELGIPTDITGELQCLMLLVATITD